MSWKDFIKPETSKLVVFLVFFLFSIIIFFSWGAPPPAWLSSIELIINILMPPLLEGITVFIVWIPYWYIIACIIVFIYNKYKNRKKVNK